VKQWVIPPTKSASFVATMETVLDLYREPYDARRPVVCLDERPCLLRGEVRTPLPMRPGRDARYDHEYVRGSSSCCVLMAFEPLRARRRVWVRPQRRRLEFAEVVRALADEVYSDAETIRLVCDNLNTHTPAAFYERYPPAEARRLAERIEFIYTPVHGSWLNPIEIEFSVMVRQCLRRRIGTLPELAQEVEAWTAARNAEGATVDWQFTTADARIKLRRLYPSVST